MIRIVGPRSFVTVWKSKAENRRGSLSDRNLDGVADGRLIFFTIFLKPCPFFFYQTVLVARTVDFPFEDRQRLAGGYAFVVPAPRG